jgi:hypothetical protein
MKYRNTRTGVVVEVFSEIRGEWEKVEEQPSPVDSVPEKKAPKKRKKASK